MATGFSNVGEIASFMAWQLDDVPHSIYRAKRTTSVYLHFFEDIGTLTIRDHRPKRKTMPRIKWNILIGYRGKKKIAINSTTVYYYNEHQIFDCLRDIDRARRSCNTLHRR